MNGRDIKTALQKLDFNFATGLDEDERERARALFRKYYAQEMGRAAAELFRHQKVQNNLEAIEQKKVMQLKQMGEGLRKRMQSHQNNRQRLKQQQLKNYKKYEQSWKRKWEEMIHRKQMNEQELIEKAEERSRQMQQFWEKKRTVDNYSEQMQRGVGGDNYEQLDKTISLENNCYAGCSKMYREGYFTDRSFGSIPHRHRFKSGSIMFKDAKIEGKSRPASKDQQIRRHQLKSQEKYINRQAEQVKACWKKLQMIEQRRHSLHDKMEQTVLQSKKNREIRQNPEVIQRNKERSHNLYFRVCNRVKGDNEEMHSKERVDFDPRKLNKTVEARRITKSRQDEVQLFYREYKLSNKMQRIKDGKLQRLVRQAIVSLRHSALGVAG